MVAGVVFGLRLRHYSTEQTIDPFPVAQPGPGYFVKPRGLWVSDETGDAWGWTDCCDSDGFAIGPWEHAVTLNPDATILHIANETGLRDFHAAHATTVSPRGVGIDWQAVATRWQGVIITPYLWSMRLNSDVSWYYTWDCASGCIWDPLAIAEVVLVGRTYPAGQKLTDRQVAMMRARWETGWYTQRELADGFGVSRSYVSRLVNGKRRTRDATRTPTVVVG